MTWLLTLLLGLSEPTSDPAQATAHTEPASAFDEAEPPSPAAEPIPVPAPPRERPPGRARASVTEGFGLDSADGRFGLSLGLLASMRYGVDVVAPRQPSHGFTVRLARTMLQGHLWGDRVLFQLQPEFAGNVRLLDLNTTINLHPAFSLLVGQYRPWFTRGFPTNLPVQLMLDRGTVLDAFRYDRDIGVTVMGLPAQGRVEYYFGVLDGEGLDRQAPRNPQPLLTARVVAAPLGSVGYSHTTAANAERNLPFRFAIGANAATNEVDRVQLVTDVVTGQEQEIEDTPLRTAVLGGDVVLQGWRMMAMGEAFWRQSRPERGVIADAWGAYGQVSIVAVRKRLEFATRAGALRLEDETTTRVPIEPGLNVYLVGDHAKLQLRYRCELLAEAGTCNTHGVHLQGQLWF